MITRSYGPGFLAGNLSVLHAKFAAKEKVCFVLK
jgi:hypothetical protein